MYVGPSLPLALGKAGMPACFPRAHRAFHVPNRAGKCLGCPAVSDHLCFCRYLHSSCLQRHRSILFLHIHSWEAGFNYTSKRYQGPGRSRSPARSCHSCVCASADLSCLRSHPYEGKTISIPIPNVPLKSADLIRDYPGLVFSVSSRDLMPESGPRLHLHPRLHLSPSARVSHPVAPTTTTCCNAFFIARQHG